MAIITISRGSLSGGEQLARKLGERLGAKVISREVIVEAAQKYDVSEERLVEEMHSPPGIWDRLTHHKEDYILAIQATLANMVIEGQTIYHGNAGQMLLKDLSKVIKLRLVAPTGYRVRAAMMELNLSKEDAMRHIDSVDVQRCKWVRHLYGVEWSDAELYDLVLNLGQMSLDTATELVVDLAGRKEYKRTPELEQERRDFALDRLIRAELTFRSEFPKGSVEVRVARGNVTLCGGPFFDKNRGEIVKFVQAINGVGAVRVPGEASVDIVAAQQEKKAADVMLPISRYPYVHQDLSIKEAIGALSGSSVKLNDGHVISPRFILVHDHTERLVGILARRNLMRGLVPELAAMERARERAEELAPQIAGLSFPVTFRWHSLFCESALVSAAAPVETIMAPIRASVKPDDDLTVVISIMLQHNVDLVPVIDGHRPVGVILMTDVYDSVAEFIMESGGTPAPQRGDSDEG
jgi:cytidylate kinase